MKLFLPEEAIITGKGKLPLPEGAGLRGKASDFALVTAVDEGFLTDELYMNYYLDTGRCISRFGTQENCSQGGVRLSASASAEDIPFLIHRKAHSTYTTIEYGEYPQNVLSIDLSDMAMREYRAGALEETGRIFPTPDGNGYTEYLFNGKRIVTCEIRDDVSLGYLRLSDGETYPAGTRVFIEVNPIVWYYDEKADFLLSRDVLFYTDYVEGLQAWMNGTLSASLLPPKESADGEYDFRCEMHDELELIRAYVNADIPIFIHGLSGDGKSDRVRQIDPDAMDIELINETPETMNGKVIYNEAKDEIREVKPAWLVELEEKCKDGKLHVLFFDELTNATKQTQSIIFKIILLRIVNNRWKLPDNVRIIAAGNDRAESNVAHDLAEPLFGRFAHIYIRTTVENWMPWAVENRINPYVMEFLANHGWLLRTEFTGEEANADPRRWEMASHILDASGNDFGLLQPVVGTEITEEFIRFFKSRKTLHAIADYTDEDILSMNAARRYQLAQQCLNVADSQLEKARELVARLGGEYLAWYDYTRTRKQLN